MKKIFRVFAPSFIFITSTAIADFERVSVSSSGEQAEPQALGEGFGSSGPAVSEDGRFVVFDSSASNLVDDDTDDFRDVFVHDRKTGFTERVNVTPDGLAANAGTSDPFNHPNGPTGRNLGISADGRFVLYPSIASNLVDGDTNRLSDIFIHDRNTGINERVSVSSSGKQSNGFSRNASISANSRVIAFTSVANNLVTGDLNGHADLFWHDRNTGMTQRIDLPEAVRIKVAQTMSRPEFGGISVSANGRFVVFDVATFDLSDDTDSQVYLHDRETGITTLVSEPADGIFRSPSGDPSISADGRFVSYTSGLNNLVENDTNNSADIFVFDRITGITEIASVSTSGAQNNRSSFLSSISANGRFVTFISYGASAFVDNDSADWLSIFVRDRETGITRSLKESTTPQSIQGTIDSPVYISGNGQFVAFDSNGSDLVQGDTNETRDVFIADNPLLDSTNYLVIVEKLINNQAREALGKAAQLAAGTLYKQSYKVTNNSVNRIYQVRVFEDGNLVCNFYSLDPRESKERCVSFQTVLEGDQHAQVVVTAKVSGSGEELTSFTNAYYMGLNSTSGGLRVTHRINNINADTADQAPTLNSQQATLLFKVENTGELELYQVRTYHDPVSPVNSGWDLQCILGPMKPGQVRYCKKVIDVTESGLNQAMGRVQGRNAIRGATEVINASNPTYFIVP